MVEDLIALRKMLDEDRDRWSWELEQSENSRLKGDEQHFLRAKAGFRNAEDAISKLDVIIGNATGWAGLFGTEGP
jgi:hypothetical protein